MTYCDDERQRSQLEPPDPSPWVLRKRLWTIYREWGEFREGRGVRVPDTVILGTLWMARQLAGQRFQYLCVDTELEIAHFDYGMGCGLRVHGPCAMCCIEATTIVAQ